MASDARLCPYLDIPIQHINDEILRKMKRHTDSTQIKKTIDNLRARIPGVHIRTSLIVGFPSESHTQFDELLQFVRDYPLNHIGIFAYSREEGTVAGRMDEQVAEEIKVERQQRLAALQSEVVERLNKKMIGKQLEVVIESYHPDSKLLLVGRHRVQTPEIDGQVILNDWSEVDAFGERYLVEISDCAGYDLVGRVVKKRPSSLRLFG